MASAGLLFQVQSQATAMHGDVWLAPYGRGLQALYELTPGAHAGSRAKADGRPRTVPRGIVTGVCLAMITCLAMTSRPGMARAQSGTEDILAIPVHPRVATIMHLPDGITRARVNPGTSMRVTLIGRTLHVRPDPGVPTGMEALLEVETPTMLLTLRLYVVERSEDAREELVVIAMQSEQRAEVGPVRVERAARAAGKQGVSAAVPGASPVGPTRLMAPPLLPMPHGGQASLERARLCPAKPSTGSAAGTESAAGASSAPRFAIAAHAVAGLGLAGAEIVGYRPDTAAQLQHALGLRLTAARPGASWALEADVSGEWPAGPMAYRSEGATLQVSGPRLRLETGMSTSVGTQWNASAYAGLGVQMQLRRVEESANPPQSTLEQGLVLALGVGLHYRTRGNILLGLDFVVRQGWPDDYHSMSALLTVGRFLEQGE